MGYKVTNDLIIHAGSHAPQSQNRAMERQFRTYSNVVLLFFLIHDSSIGFLEMAGLREQLKSLLGTNIDLICDSDVSDVFKYIIKRDDCCFVRRYY